MRIRVHMPESTFEWESSVRCFRVGRGDGCAIRFEGPSSQFASWEHAEFSLGNDEAAYVTDLGSSNGTYVDGALIRGAAPLHVGSIVQCGRAGPRLELLALSAVAARPIPITLPAPAPVGSTDAATTSEETELEGTVWHLLTEIASRKKFVALGAIVALAAVVTFLLGNLLFPPANHSGLGVTATLGTVLVVAGVVAFFWAYRRFAEQRASLPPAVPSSLATTHAQPPRPVAGVVTPVVTPTHAPPPRPVVTRWRQSSQVSRCRLTVSAPDASSLPRPKSAKTASGGQVARLAFIEILDLSAPSLGSALH